MKPKLQTKMFGALVLVGLISIASDSRAVPPAQHAERGIIETVDYATKSLTVTSEKRDDRKTFTWAHNTSFREKSTQPCKSLLSRMFSIGQKTTAESLQPGRSVRFYYRKEVGRYVIRGVTILATVDHACGCCPRSTSATTPTERLRL